MSSRYLHETQVSLPEQVKDQIVKEISIFMQGAWPSIAFHMHHRRDGLDGPNPGKPPVAPSNLTKPLEWKRWRIIC
ncbi:hypothetical protein H109_04766 [Trichophyton interdigitale MR816]|uniref:Uncharacterized protein n=1 Tax=Trichophyton interdigitale (strain MR816) TaxID=1215338 RepID=A0A059J7A5_TRIIM|nr:hypothetical protein H109_04766 [Trichophyton interdigitale MR816]